jgi:uncharacterized membrane protein YbhN (UPF0104 family)
MLHEPTAHTSEANFSRISEPSLPPTVTSRYIFGGVRSQFRTRPILLSAVATAIAAVAVLVIARVTGVDNVGRAFDSVHPGWIALIGAAELIAYPAYMVAYRSVARLHGHPVLTLPLVARVVIAGFGPFTIGGGFGVDRQTLEALHEDEHSARVRVLALGVLEWAVLAPTACIAAIVLLATGANVMPSLLWPWAIGVPVGFTFAVWASVPSRAERLCRIRGVRREWVASALEGLGAVRTMVSAPHRYWGAWLGTGLYWAADIAAFYGGLRTFGLDPGVGKIIIAYATGYAATRRSLPLGGAGVTEALMTYALYWVRQPLAPALAAVVAYRVFNFLLAATPALIAHSRLEETIGKHRGKSARAKVPG